MLALRDLQTAFRQALLEDDKTAVAALGAEIADGELSASERLAVYRNNIFASLTDALRETFPVICRLVDERFFSYAAHEFIASHPPQRPSLAEYGGAFPDFLAAFPPCRELAYLADVARLEWLMNLAAHAAETDPVSPDSLASIGADDAAHLVLTLRDSYGYVSSPWPVDRIWRANRPGSGDERPVNLAAGGAHLEVSRQGEDVVFRALDAAAFAFRQALAESAPLGEAISRAIALEPEFAAGNALAALFAEGAVTAVTLSSSELAL